MSKTNEGLISNNYHKLLEGAIKFTFSIGTTKVYGINGEGITKPFLNFMSNYVNNFAPIATSNYLY